MKNGKISSSVEGKEIVQEEVGQDIIDETKNNEEPHVVIDGSSSSLEEDVPHLRRSTHIRKLVQKLSTITICSIC